jgi:hypothetical protein
VRVIVRLQTASRVWDVMSDYANNPVNHWLWQQLVQTDLPIRANGFTVT